MPGAGRGRTVSLEHDQSCVVRQPVLRPNCCLHRDRHCAADPLREATMRSVHRVCTDRAQQRMFRSRWRVLRGPSNATFAAPIHVIPVLSGVSFSMLPIRHRTCSSCALEIRPTLLSARHLATTLLRVWRTFACAPTCRWLTPSPPCRWHGLRSPAGQLRPAQRRRGIASSCRQAGERCRAR